jgi:hypothetical protein
MVCSGSGRGRTRTACPAVAVSNDHCADGETCWRQTPYVTAYTHHGRWIRARPACPRHRDAPAAATGRSAEATNRHQVWRRPSPPTPYSRPACSLSDAAPSGTQLHRRPAPGTRRDHHCGRSPVTPSTTAGRYDRRSFALSGLPRSRVRFLHAQPRPDDRPCAAAEREGSRPTDAGTAGSEAGFRPACAPFPGSNHHGATLRTTNSAARR